MGVELECVLVGFKCVANAGGGTLMCGGGVLSCV